MTIIFKPNGVLDINTESTDLPEQGDGKNNILSGAMVRCKNLNVSRMGVLSTRNGSSRIVNFVPIDTVDFLFEAGGDRYEFGGVYSYYNEEIISTGGVVQTPTIIPAAGNYAAEQTVTISCMTSRANIYFTTDGSSPNQQSSVYSTPFSIPFNTYVIFYAVDPLGLLSDSDYVVAFYGDSTSKYLVTELGYYLLTEISNNLMTEGG